MSILPYSIEPGTPSARERFASSIDLINELADAMARIAKAVKNRSQVRLHKFACVSRVWHVAFLAQLWRNYAGLANLAAVIGKVNLPTRSQPYGKQYTCIDSIEIDESVDFERWWKYAVWMTKLSDESIVPSLTGVHAALSPRAIRVLAPLLGNHAPLLPNVRDLTLARIGISRGRNYHHSFQEWVELLDPKTVRSLEVREGYFHGDDTFFRLLPSMTGLQHLEIEFGQDMDIGFSRESLSQAIASLRNLKNITLRLNENYDWVSDQLLWELGSLSSLRACVLYPGSDSHPSIGAAHLYPVSKRMNKERKQLFTSLRTLELFMDDNDISYLNVFGTNYTHSFIRLLSYVAGGDEAMDVRSAQLMQISRVAGLRDLNLGFQSPRLAGLLTQDTAIPVSYQSLQHLGTLTQLEHLYLYHDSNFCIDGDQLVELTSNWPLMRDLTFDAQRTVHIDSLPGLLRNMRHLRSLYLGLSTVIPSKSVSPGPSDGSKNDIRTLYLVADMGEEIVPASGAMILAKFLYDNIKPGCRVDATAFGTGLSDQFLTEFQCLMERKFIDLYVPTIDPMTVQL